MSIRQGSTIIAGSSGSGGTSNYNNLENKPSINGITLEGNKTTEDLNINSLPDQTGNEGKVLITNGTEASWQTLPETGLPLFAHIWSDHLLTNSSYLRADTFSWQDGNIYYTAYNELVNEKNLTTETSTDTINNITITYYRTPKGYKIVLPDMADNLVQLYESTGTAWYYILDVDNTRFKLPRNSRYESGTTTENAGDFGAESLPNITGTAASWHDSDTDRTDFGAISGKVTGAFTSRTGYRNKSVNETSITADNAASCTMLGFDASRSSSTYKSGAKVNPDHITQFLYFYVGNTIQNETTINIAEITEALNNKADRDFGNITDGTYDFLTTKQVANCITKIPQDIKLELNNGTLTLKAGSKIYAPNGVGVFDEVVIQSDYSQVANTSWTSGLLLYNETLNAIEVYPQSLLFSGTEQPSESTYIWYNTGAGSIKRYSNNTMIENTITFPIAEFTGDGSKMTSISVFNGYGYIGSTIFVLPGVEGLIPNGRNENGGLNNTKFINNSIKTYESSGWASAKTNIDMYIVQVSGFQQQFTLQPIKRITLNKDATDEELTLSFVEKENQWYIYRRSTAVWNKTDVIIFGKLTFMANATLTSFNPKTTFQAIDRSDTEWASTASKPSDRYIDLTLQASGTTYIAPSNGWFYLKKSASSTNYGYVEYTNNSTGITETNVFCGGTPLFGTTFSTKKGESVMIKYTNMNETTNTFRFIYDEGSK